MDVLIACEFSGAVRDALIARGVSAISCDLEPCETPGPHYRGDVRDLLDEPWGAVLAFPDCTHLCNSGARHFAKKRADGRQAQAVAFFSMFASLKCERVAIENPVGVMSSLYRKPDQIIHPFMFGDPFSKATCLWRTSACGVGSAMPYARSCTQAISFSKSKSMKLRCILGHRWSYYGNWKYRRCDRCGTWHEYAIAGGTLKAWMPCRAPSATHLMNNGWITKGRKPDSHASEW